MIDEETTTSGPAVRSAGTDNSRWCALRDLMIFRLKGEEIGGRYTPVELAKRRESYRRATFIHHEDEAFYALEGGHYRGERGRGTPSAPAGTLAFLLPVQELEEREAGSRARNEPRRMPGR